MLNIHRDYIQSMARSLLYRLSEARTYFLRGHGNWLVYPISIINFISITFYLLIDNLTIIPEELKLLRYYIFIFVFTYIPGAIILGYWDMNRGTYRVEQKMAKELSPIWKEVFERLDKIEERQERILQAIETEG